MKNILLLDAEISWLACVRKAFVSKGYNVVTLPGSGMLKEYLRGQIPDLVVVHVGLLSDNVRRILKTFKSSANYWRIPVILMPQATLSLNELSMPEVHECIPGSFNMATLLMKVERLLFPERVIFNGALK